MLLTERQVIDIGSSLIQFTKSEAWNVAVKVLEEHITSKVFTSDPMKPEVREDAYQLHRALRELIATFDAIAVQAEQHLAEIESGFETYDSEHHEQE